MAIYDGEETLLDYVLMNIPDGYHTFRTNAGGQQVEVEVEFVNILGSTIYTISPTLGDNVADSRMLILKYHGNLTVEAGVILRPQVRKRGMFLCVLGNLVNNGTISMTARGAIAVGQNVFIAKDINRENVLVPAVGGSGGNGGNAGSGQTRQGNPGGNGVNGQSGGGGGGTGNFGRGGNGSKGTSYSGGTGGGGGGYDNRSGSHGSLNGGRGGEAGCNRGAAGGGAGNPGGSGGCGGTAGQSGTGGLLIVTATGKILNEGSIQSNGSAGGTGYPMGGGGSGGGSINLLVTQPIEGSGTVTSIGGNSPNNAKGGDGSVRTFFIGDSLINLTYNSPQVLQRNIQFSVNVTIERYVKGVAYYEVFLRQGDLKLQLKEPTEFEGFVEDAILIFPETILENDKDYEFVVLVTGAPTSVEKSFKLRIVNTTPEIQITNKGLHFDVMINDLEMDLVKYRAQLNNKQKMPLDIPSLFTDYIQTPLTYSRTFSSNEVKVDEENEFKVIAVDKYGGESVETITFIGEYSGLMFSDLNEEFYSTDMGEVLKYLMTDTMMAGTSSFVHPIKLINKYPFKVENIRLFADAKDLQGVGIQFSEEEVPFIAKKDLTFDVELDYGDEVIFYVRVSSDPTAMGGGVFDIYIKADPV